MYRENSFWKIHSLISGSDDTEIKESEKIKPLSDDCPICDEKNCVESCKEGNICIKCGCEINTNITFGQEYRYYGANDNNSSDPTRCGMPINPLLKESSYGCKVLCKKNTTYEMRKIRRQAQWQSMPYHEKSRYDEFERIKIMANNSGIPKCIIDDALIYHKKIFFDIY